MLALAHLKFVIARGWCQSGFFQIGFQSLNPLNQLFLERWSLYFPMATYIKLNCVMDIKYTIIFLFTTAYRLIILIYQRSITNF